MTWPIVPDDVIDWIQHVVSEANDAATERLTNQPNVRETSLDDALINGIEKYSAPKRLPSGAVVMLEVHNIGGLRQIERWELADIAFIVHVTVEGRPLSRKIGLLQSKRLYPTNSDVDVDDPLTFKLGLNGLLDAEVGRAFSQLRRDYSFKDSSRFGAIVSDDPQLARIKEFHKRFGEAVFYLLYAPVEVPLDVRMPTSAYRKVLRAVEGARVVRAAAIEKAVKRAGSTRGGPTLKSVKRNAGAEYWRLEDWASNLLLRCKVGRQYTEADIDLINGVVVRRSGPIGAAIRINIDLPEALEEQS